jgi:hypothetical protein
MTLEPFEQPYTAEGELTLGSFGEPIFFDGSLLADRLAHHFITPEGTRLPVRVTVELLGAQSSS